MKLNKANINLSEVSDFRLRNVLSSFVAQINIIIDQIETLIQFYFKTYPVNNAKVAELAINADHADNADTVDNVHAEFVAGDDGLLVQYTHTGTKIEAITPDTWHYVGATGEPAFGTNWSNFGVFPEMPARFKIDITGTVHIQGRVKNSGNLTATSVIFTLPSGYRPSYNIARLQLYVDRGSVRSVYINTIGQVIGNFDATYTYTANSSIRIEFEYQI